MAGYDGGSRFDEIYGKSPNLERMAYEAKRDAEYAVDAIKNFGAIASGKVGGAPAPSQLGVGDVLGGVSAGLKAFQDARKTSGTRMAGDALGSAFNIASSLPNYSSVFSSPALSRYRPGAAHRSISRQQRRLRFRITPPRCRPSAAERLSTLVT